MNPYKPDVINSYWQRMCGYSDCSGVYYIRESFMKTGGEPKYLYSSYLWRGCDHPQSIPSKKNMRIPQGAVLIFDEKPEL